ncbi:membrane fusion protein, cobalt-zinc-cadmium efflux system [Dyella jiangningensis]|uniref:efflux RND transporter periplasmic adaptor subunit n=1 Tax=Dyella sp. AtDHG13 TaxID=1938897 RepID=UPI000889BE4B|nr:efflux RND transporter periplasmic adaptor subunit [Dyella sp. AtDHG13]PXV59474.1 cobalt-zinc-cadmium efflux system membrane fusion protein [Dyella sp. AtDHG13]SDJ16678.1 membrane fusion protein, cobalt-zinc-cadmium efflux system [Dyella jiangningensis]
MTHRLTKLFIAFAAALSLAACAHHADDQAAPPSVVDDHGVLRVPDGSPLRKALVIAPVEMRAAPHARVFPATVEADPAHTANVVAPLTGRITELKVGLGDHVERNQLLAVIESGDMAQASADAAKASDALALAKKQLDRARGVQQAGGNAVKDLEAAQSGYNQAQAELNRAQTRLQSLNAGAQAAGARGIRITSPVSGYVTALSAAQGSYVNDTTTPLMVIADLHAVWITANVPEADVGGIAKGQAVDATLPAYPDQVFHGQVSFVSQVLQADTRRDMVRAAFDNADGRLKPNMFAKATIAVPQPAQVFVPDSALLMNNDDTTVFVEVSPWAFERRTVELSYDETAGARVLKGLKAGDRVVVKGGVLLND